MERFNMLDLTHLLDEKEVWVVADLHGRNELFQRLLNQIGFSKETHAVISLGDLEDRGEDSPSIIQWFIENGYCIRGNHEDLWLDALRWTQVAPYDENGGIAPEWVNMMAIDQSFLKNGMGQTLQQFSELRVPPEKWLGYFESLPYAITVGEYLIVHAGVDPNKSFDDQTVEDLTWIIEGFVDYDGEIPAESRMGKRIICGHRQTYRFSNGGTPVILPDRIHLDIGTASNLGLAAFCINTGEIAMVDAKHKWERLYAIKEELKRQQAGSIK